jgi:tetratricopeptide (TPR) repeat protein
VARDPAFALAHAWLGAANVVCVFNYYCDRDLLESGLAAARRAVELQPDLGDAQRALGTGLVIAGRLDEGIPALERAVELNPNDFAAIGNLGLAYSLRGDWDRAIQITRRSIERDPVRSYIAYANLAGYYRFLEMYDRARAEAKQALALRLDFPTALSNLAITDLLDGRTAEALALTERMTTERADPSALSAAAAIFALAGEDERARSLLARVHAAAPEAPPTDGSAPAVLLAHLLVKVGERERAAELLAHSERVTQEQVDQGNRMPELFYNLAGIATVRDQREEALRYLERAVEAGWNSPAVARRDPALAPLRQEPRFQAAVQRMDERVRAQRLRVERAGW